MGDEVAANLTQDGPSGEPAARWIQGLFVGSMVPVLAGVYALIFTGRNYWPHANLFTWYTVLGIGGLALLRRHGLLHGWRSGLVVMLATVHLCVLTPEIWLRWAGFRYESGIGIGPTDHPSQFVRLETSSELFWTLPSETPGVSPQGFRTYPLPRPESPEVIRVVVLGDSLAFQGYPETTEMLLNSHDEASRYEILNMSLAGYSSHQGRVVTRQHGEAMAADQAVIAYGWNDHWLAWGAPDANRVAPAAPSRSQRLARAVLRRSRIAQAARYLVAPAGPASLASKPELRVPPESFRANLEALGKYWQEGRRPPIFMTLPSTHPQLGVPAYLIERQLALDEDSVLQLHRQYNEIIREVATNNGWPILDLDQQLADLPTSDLERLFVSDGIHFSEAGLALVAERVADAILASPPPSDP